MANDTLANPTLRSPLIPPGAGINRPNLFIAGAPKSGTTALFRYLGDHPEVFMPELKEPHFFATDLNRGISDPGKYLDLFAGAGEQHRIRGEASVWYMYSREALANIYRYDPASRIIVMLRNPVDLVYSKHAQLVYNFEEDETDFEKAWGLQEKRRRGESMPRYVENPEFLFYGDIGKLGDQVERLLSIFHRRQVKIVLHEDFRRDTGGIYREILDFLGLDDEGRRDFPRINENCIHRSQTIGRMIRKPLPGLQEKVHVVEKFLGLRQLWGIDMVTRLNTKTRTRPELDLSFRKELQETFREDIGKLSSLIDRDLSQWLNHN